MRPSTDLTGHRSNEHTWCPSVDHTAHIWDVGNLNDIGCGDIHHTIAERTCLLSADGGAGDHQGVEADCRAPQLNPQSSGAGMDDFGNRTVSEHRNADRHSPRIGEPREVEIAGDVRCRANA